MATKTSAKRRSPRANRTSRISGANGVLSSPLGAEVQEFVNSFRQKRFLELVEGAKTKTPSTKTTGPRLKLPVSKLMGWGQNSERTLMMAFGWYWEPLLHDLAFYEEMRDSVSLVDGQIQKVVDLAMDGFKLQCDDQEALADLEDALLIDPSVDFHECLRRSMTDLYSLGNCYVKPEWSRDDQGRLIPEVFRPIRANAIRKLRDDKLKTEGYVQLLHRPSEFILGGTPHTPTVYVADDIMCGIMRSFGWYAYGKPLMASLPFVLRLKLQMERDLAEMLHQHLPRIDIVFTPDEQMNQDQVDDSVDQVKKDVAAMRPTDNFVHTPDIVIEYKGPQGHNVDFSPTQKHIEEQHFYVLPFSPSCMGRDSIANPYAEQQRWTITTKIVTAIRNSAIRMYAPALKKMADDWGIPVITMGFSDLDPENTQKLAEADEYATNNAVIKRDAGFLDQDTAARQGTKNHPDGPVKKAAAPGALPPPVDPNKATTPGDKPPSNKSAGRKVRRSGPKTDGTRVPDKDKRPKGKRHKNFTAFEDAALAELALL